MKKLWIAAYADRGETCDGKPRVLKACAIFRPSRIGKGRRRIGRLRRRVRLRDFRKRLRA